jgi:phospholipid/cholesterol/gamma-HCH transport system substrate-binding protein
LKFSKEIKVGILALVAIVILYVGFSFLKGADFFDPSNTYYAIYENVDGLTVSNPVKVNGYRIGRVSSIKLMQRGEQTHMLVGFDVTDDLAIYQGSEAMLVDDDILGSKAIALNIRQGGKLLQDEDTLLSSKDVPISQMIRERADPIVAEVDTTLTRVNNILQDMEGSGVKIESAMSDLQETASMLRYMVAANRRDINAITANVKDLSAALNDPESGIKPFMLKLNQMADTINNLELRQTVANANQALTNIEQLTQGLEQGQGSLGKLLKDDSLYHNLNRSSEDLDRLLEDIRQNPGRYIDFRFSILGIGR